jgi:hypothetical protein
MPCFPQLLTGASGQYPIRKQCTCRTIRNRSLDGREIKLADPAASSVDWTLTFEELIDDEMASLRDFFLNMEGQLGTFTFLDPTDNLLAWSEKFDEAVWQKDPLLLLSSGVGDPFGGSSAFQLTNPNGASQRLGQTLNVPGSFYYSLSIWLRSERAGVVTLLRGGEIGARNVDQNWQRIVFSAASSDDSETVEFGIEFPPGVIVELFGAQVESQIGASGYKKTTSSSGVHPMTRFADDVLKLSTTGPGRHGCILHLRN